MWPRLKTALADGVVLGVKYGITLVIVGFLLLWAVGDYLQVRAAATYLHTVTDVTDQKGNRLTRTELIDQCIRDVVSRQQAAQRVQPAPPPPAK
jgi:hypothetical protein